MFHKICDTILGKDFIIVGDEIKDMLIATEVREIEYSE
jgi:hypothetical protein